MDIEKEVQELYLQELSGSEISAKLQVHIRQVYRILDKLGVSRRTSSAQNKIRFLRSPKSYQFKEKLSAKERDLMIAGAMLYYGEGAKTGGSVDLANSDTRILKVFLKFLRDICRVKEERLRFYLYCFSDQNPQKLIDYWVKELGVNKRSFTKPHVRKLYPTLHRRMPYGVLHIRYSDLRLLEKILDLNLKISGNMLE